MELLLILSIISVVALLGYLTGYVMRKRRLSKLRRASIQKPLYNIQDDISPAEFGCIVDGTIGHKELVAEAILLAIKGHIDFVRNSVGRFSVVKSDRTHLHSTNLTPIQSVIMKGLNGRDGFFTLQPAVEHEVKQSLIRKGWIVGKKLPSRGLPEVSVRQVFIAVLTGLMVVLAAVVAALAFGASGSDVFTIVLLTLGAEFILVVIIGSIVPVFRSEIMHEVRFTLAATAKYDQQWKDVYGVYEYMRVSGGDVFTPDYETLNFNELDLLYPYAVAVGLDKKVLRLFA